MEEEKVARDVFELLRLMQEIVPDALRSLDAHVGADLAQEVRLRLWKRLVPRNTDAGPDFKLPTPVSERYIRKAAANIRASFLRQLTKERQRLESGYSIQDIPEKSEPHADDTAMRESVNDILSGLDVDDREILRRYYLRGESHKTIAQALGITVNASRQRLSRAREKARDLALEAGIKLDDFW